MGFTIGLFNLWLPFALGYGLVWLLTRLSSHQARQEVGGEVTGEYIDPKLMFLFGFFPFIALCLAAIFVPLNFGILFRPGLVIFIVGITLNIITVKAFIRSQEALKTKGPYRYSRNPMYMADLVYILGLNLIGWSGSTANLVFILLTLAWIGGTHWCVLREETFLEQKFGRAYIDYKKRTPRYLFL